ncbi:hypothetical protein AcV7_004353 [Taiwanofungus camphoratus]|nr:hypothetical protein AcV7_004353 [Antrodia cinnamomea]
MQSSLPSTAPSTPNLSRFLAEKYPSTKARFPGEGRRKWRLRVAQAFWDLAPDEKASYLAAPAQGADENANFVTDDDPYDEISADAPGLGILVRTDYSNEDAWQAFCTKLKDAEAEFLPARPSEGDKRLVDPVPGGTPSAAGDEDMDEDEDEDDQHFPIVFVLDGPASYRQKFINISNLTALRLLNDVDIRRAPMPPPGTKRIKPPNCLVDHDGWQEIYTGKTVWIYDANSNVDQCAKLVGQQGGPYGTATADSWRARVSHICELQVNLSSNAMSIDFGGLDRWDYSERVRNMEEASETTG